MAIDRYEELRRTMLTGDPVDGVQPVGGVYQPGGVVPVASEERGFGGAPGGFPFGGRPDGFPVNGGVPGGFPVNGGAVNGFDGAGRTETIGRTAPIGKDEIAKAYQRLQIYKSAKMKLDELIKEGEMWFAMQDERARRDQPKRRRTNWLMSSIVQKHADFMDNTPEVTVLPREASDQESAKALTGMLPAIMTRGKWESAYDMGCWDKLKFGTGVYAVLWDNAAGNGLGDIVYRVINLLAFFWEPGIRNIQDSHDIFYVTERHLDDLKNEYPENEELQNVSGGTTEDVTFLHDTDTDKTDKVTVIDWYYKKAGQVHLCKFVRETVLYSSENEGAPIYADGRYPFVLDRFLPDETGPAGIGLYELGRDTQADLDDANELFMKNLKVGARPRYFSAVNGGINEKEFADLNRDIVHVAGSSVEDRYVRPIEANVLPGNFMSLYEAKVNELKENTYNRDVNAGGSSGTTTASGIAALQEAGSKTSRDAIRYTYQAFTEIVDMTIERIREFYDAPRSFRILGPNNNTAFTTFDNAGLKGQAIGAFGEELGQREPIFDYDVRVSKQSVYSRATNNQEVLQFFQMGFFNPANATPALACLEVLQLDNKDKLVEIIKQNSLIEQFNSQVLPALLQAAATVSPELYDAAMQAAMGAGLMQAQQVPTQTADAPEQQGPQVQGMSYMDRQRAIANDRSSPQ